MKDQFQVFQNAAAVTPSDTNNLSPAAWSLLIGTGGTLKVDTLGGQTGVALTVPAGLFPLMVTRVYATGTAATGIVALW
jgi:hypothetical protein